MQIVDLSAEDEVAIRQAAEFLVDRLPDANGPGKPDISMAKRIAPRRS